MWRLMSSGVYHIVWQICTNVSDESTASSCYLKDEESRFLHSTGNYLLNHTASHTRRWLFIIMNTSSLTEFVFHKAEPWL